tara:strand:- start:11927 stop:13801 length:1875 start_codon:yes stop_codon:yes gene_type:complete
MSLLQISEPGQSTAPHEHKLAIGIDLGTTNSLVATVRSGEAVTLPDSDGNHILPSVVRYTSDEIVVGNDALKYLAKDPLNTIVSVKRLIGRAVEDIDKLGDHLPYDFSNSSDVVPKISTSAGVITPIEVSAEVLKTLVGRAEGALGGELSGAVITVPAYFDDAQRQATKDAAKLADINVLRLLNEPTAAALAYGLDASNEGIYAIYDLGGGTFDISILRLNRGVFEVLATGGNTALGGDDFDKIISSWIIETITDDIVLDLNTHRSINLEARRIKEALAKDLSVSFEIELPMGNSYKGILERGKLDELIRPLIKKTIISCKKALRDCGKNLEEIMGVVMVGGSTRTLLVRSMVEDFFKCKPLTDIDPDRVVSVGAAIQANILVGNNPESDMLLLDVNPLSLGIETMGHLVEKIIPRNTTIPVAKAQEFTTFKDGQTAMSVHVLQGEREMVSDCRSLARFELRQIPPMVAGAARIKVTFSVDADGLLSVEAEEQSSMIKASVEVKPSYGLTDEEVANMLRSSIEHAGEDMKLRKLSEIKVDASRVIEALTSALEDDGSIILNKDELSMINEALDSLKYIKDTSNDELKIKAAIEGVEETSNFYVERRMNSSIRKAMAGHKVEDFE